MRLEPRAQTTKHGFVVWAPYDLVPSFLRYTKSILSCFFVAELCSGLECRCVVK